MDFIVFYIYLKTGNLYQKQYTVYLQKTNEYTIVLFNKILMPNYRHQSFGWGNIFVLCDSPLADKTGKCKFIYKWVYPFITGRVLYSVNEIVIKSF